MLRMSKEKQLDFLDVLFFSSQQHSEINKRAK